MEEFSLYEQTKPVNKDIEITYTPDSSIEEYTLTIYRNDEVYSQTNITSKNKQDIKLTETGKYKIEIKYISNKEEQIKTSGEYIIDKQAPKLSVGDRLLTMKQGYELDLFADVSATDNVDGDLSTKITTNYDELDLNKVGLHKLVYTVSDEAGNITSKTVNINVLKNDDTQLLLVQATIIAALVIVAMVILKYRQGMSLEKRISKYSIEPKNDTRSSLFDSISKIYQNLLSRISKVIGKSVFVQRYAKRYDKYVLIFDKNHKSGVDYVSTKLIIGLVFLLITIFSKTIHYDVLKLYEVCFPVLFGFFVPDVIYASKYRIHRSKIENDLLQAIIVMNNAFKSGRSITQAIHLVTTELDGAIADEFNKMYAELNFGLEIDVVFKRFAERIKIEEVNYLTASLTILNKTGGNIIKVFSSIEKTLFNKKKLKLELESMTGSSKMLVYTLFAVPFLFVILIYFIDPTYFVPLFATIPGLIISGLIIIYYIIYVYVVSKIMKVRM